MAAIILLLRSIEKNEEEDNINYECALSKKHKNTTIYYHITGDKSIMIIIYIYK